MSVDGDFILMWSCWRARCNMFSLYSTEYRNYIQVVTIYIGRNQFRRKYFKITTF